MFTKPDNFYYKIVLFLRNLDYKKRATRSPNLPQNRSVDFNPNRLQKLFLL